MICIIIIYTLFPHTSVTNQPYYLYQSFVVYLTGLGLEPHVG